MSRDNMVFPPDRYRHTFQLLKSGGGDGSREEEAIERTEAIYHILAILRKLGFVGSGHRSNFLDGGTAYDYIP